MNQKYNHKKYSNNKIRITPFPFNIISQTRDSKYNHNTEKTFFDIKGQKFQNNIVSSHRF